MQQKKKHSPENIYWRKDYKGIALFGIPGSGKTTLARLLTFFYVERGVHLVEASTEVIRPATLMTQLPESKTTFFKQLMKIVAKNKGKKIPLDREVAGKLHQNICQKYGEDVIAQALEYTAVHKKEHATARRKAKLKHGSAQPVTIISGVRGYDNAEYLRSAGYLVVFVDAKQKTVANRLAERDGISFSSARNEIIRESEQFKTEKIMDIAHIIFENNDALEERALKDIDRLLFQKTCQKCLNGTINPTINIDEKTGLCQYCDLYKKHFSKKELVKELDFLKSFIGFNRRKRGIEKDQPDILVGISGGKDSLATLYQIQKMGFNPQAFTLDTGYYPKSIFTRSKKIARILRVAWGQYTIHNHIKVADKKSFEMTADMFDEEDSPLLARKFREQYIENREHYSLLSNHAMSHVRSCQLCRRMVIRAYYDLAIQHGVAVVALGMNEWAGLSQAIPEEYEVGGRAHEAESEVETSSKNETHGKTENAIRDKLAKKPYTFSAIRKLEPFANKPPVYIVHLPFLLQQTLSQTKRILKKLDWEIPQGEVFIESNANSCLFAKAAEDKARKLLGFHPDTVRLSREVTSGFISKKQAQKALEHQHFYKKSVREVLEDADILGK